MSVAFKKFPMHKIRSTKDEQPAKGEDLISFAVNPILSLASSWSEAASLLKWVIVAVETVTEWPAGKLVELAAGNKTCFHDVFNNFMAEDPNAPPCNNFVLLLGIGKDGTSKPPVICKLKGIPSIPDIVEATYDDPHTLTKHMSVCGTTIQLERNVEGIQISGRVITFNNDGPEGGVHYAIEVFVSNQNDTRLTSFHIVCDGQGLDHLATTCDHLRTILHTLVEYPEVYPFTDNLNVPGIFGLLDETESFNQMLTLCRQNQALHSAVEEGNHHVVN